MRFRNHLWVLLTLFSAFPFSSVARADTIRITSGYLEVGGTSRGLLNGDRRGFSVGLFAPGAPWHFVFCDGGAGCAPGAVANVQHSWLGLDFPAGPATFDGITYDEVNSLSGDAWVTTAFNSSVMLPPLSSTAVLRTPFTMEGLFSLVPDDAPRTDHLLTGSGILTSTWRGDSPGAEGVWEPVLLRYDFFGAAPVPEPTTLVLAGIAGAAVAFRQRKRRTR